MGLSYRLDTCWLCKEPMNDSNEHVLPEAITYKRSLRVVGFMCNACNNRTGTQWDASITVACQPKFRADPNYLPHLRKSGPKRMPTEFITFDGEIIEGSTDYKGNFQEKRKKPRETDLGDGFASVVLEGSVCDKEFLKQIENQRKRFRGPTSETWKTAVVHGVPSHEIKISKSRISKSLIKSYMSLAYHVGIDPRICDISIPYLRGETAEYKLQEPPIFVFRECGVHYKHVILVYSMDHFLIGGAHISGLPLELYSSVLDGELYIESLVPALISTQYNGPPIMKAYVVDIKDKGHRVLDIRYLLSDSTVKFNQRQP